MAFIAGFLQLSKCKIVICSPLSVLLVWVPVPCLCSHQWHPQELVIPGQRVKEMSLSVHPVHSLAKGLHALQGVGQGDPGSLGQEQAWVDAAFMIASTLPVSHLAPRL